MPCGGDPAADRRATSEVPRLVAVVSWRIFFVTMSARVKPDAPPDAVLTVPEINTLNRIDAAGETTTAAPDTRRVHFADCHVGRLSRSQPGSAARKHGRLARPNPPTRHRTWYIYQHPSRMWVIESFTEGIRTSRPRHSQWKNCFSPFLYRDRNAIERMFCRLKDFRRIANRYHRPAVNFMAAVHRRDRQHWL